MPLAKPIRAATESQKHDFFDSKKGEKARTISRVLSWTVIHLGPASPQASCDLPEPSAGRTYWVPIWSCSKWGLPCRNVLPRTRCALTTPFHPYRPINRGWRSTLCCTGRRLTPPRSYLAPCPMEPGLSSPNFTPKWKLAATVWRTFSRAGYRG